MATAQEGGGESSGSRNRRRRGDRGNNGGQPPLGGPRDGAELAHHKGGQHGAAAKGDTSDKADSGKGGYRQGGHDIHNGYADSGKGGYRQGGHDIHNGYGRSHGYGDGRGSPGHGGAGRGCPGHGSPGYGDKGHRGRGGRENYGEALPPPPAWPAPEEQSLKDLLMQVAPQARIAENTSRLSSKASVNILSKVLSEATNNSSQEPTAGRAAVGAAHYPEGSAAQWLQPKQEDDEESAFMERWTGLFSKGSPLVQGSLEDPFSDLKKRNKVVWKKNSDREGHRQRYQQRKMEKEKAKEEAEGGAMYDSTYAAQAESGASVVYDASQTPWQPQRPPAGIQHQ